MSLPPPGFGKVAWRKRWIATAFLSRWSWRMSPAAWPIARRAIPTWGWAIRIFELTKSWSSSCGAQSMIFVSICRWRTVRLFDRRSPPSCVRGFEFESRKTACRMWVVSNKAKALSAVCIINVFASASPCCGVLSRWARVFREKHSCSAVVFETSE